MHSQDDGSGSDQGTGPGPTAADFDAWVVEPGDPLAIVRHWVDLARAAAEAEPTAAVLVSVDHDGTPDARHVLVRGFDADGFVVYTNLKSAKSEQLRARPHAALVFGWPALQRTIRVRGPVHAIDDATADAYFATRPRGSQLAAWASPQSRPVADRAALEAAWHEHETRFADGPVPRPPFWGGWKLTASSIELWHGRPSRLHDRVRFTRDGSRWRAVRLGP